MITVQREQDKPPVTDFSNSGEGTLSFKAIKRPEALPSLSNSEPPPPPAVSNLQQSTDDKVKGEDDDVYVNVETIMSAQKA